MNSLHDLNPDSPSPLPRKTYNSPQVQVYGQLRHMTTVIGNSGNSDGGTGNNKRTKA